MEYKDSKLLQAALDFQNSQADPDINDIKDFFIAGAKWMARQGETHEQYVIREIAGHDIGPAIVSYPDTFEIGDKVIVQIRKEY